MSVTMQDVAARAGVSAKTVSNVINGYPYIRPQTKERVLRSIDELGYKLNVSARHLRAGTTGMIGLTLPQLSLAYYAEIADEVIRAADALGWAVLIEQTNSVDGPVKVMSTRGRRLVDGVILCPSATVPDATGSIEPGFPTVVIGERILHRSLDHVTLPDTEAADAATQHLIDTGHRRIAVIGSHPSEQVGTAASRLEGYLRALRRAHLPYDPRFVREAGPWRRQDGAKAMRGLLDDGLPIDAAFCFNDALALGALRVLHERKLRIPEDIALVGFDDIEDARYSTPSLTTISPDRKAMARAAVELLTKLITASNDNPHAPVEIRADFRLETRESTLGPDQPVP